MDEKDRDRQRLRGIELDTIWENIGRLDVPPGDAASPGDLSAGRPVYGCPDGLAPGEMLKEYPDGRMDVVRFEGEDPPREVFVRLWRAPGS